MRKKYIYTFIICLLCIVKTQSYALPNEDPTKHKSIGNEIHVNNMEIETMIKIFSNKTKRNYILDERVKGKISIHLPGKISANDTIRILDAVLQLKGFTSVPIGNNIWKIIPAKDAKQTTIPTIKGIKGRGSPTVVTRLVNLKYVGADDVKQLLSPLISSFGMMNAYTATNSIIFIDAEENIKRIMKLINEMDVPFSNREMIIIPIKYAVASELATTIKELLGEESEKQTGSKEQNLDFVRAKMQNNVARRQIPTQTNNTGNPATVGNARSRAPKILADERTNSIIVVADEDTANRIRALIGELDSEVDMAGMNFYVYKCIHADADELANVLSTLSNGGGASSTDSGKASTGSSLSRSNNSNARNRNSSGSSFGSSKNSSTSSDSSSSGSTSGSNSSQSSTTVTFGDTLSITSDPSTNSLVIYATKTDYKRILSLIKELDIKRRQVLVEALLLEVRIEDSMSTSTEFATSGGGADGGVIGINNLGNLTNLLSDPTKLSQFTLAVASAGTLSLPGGITIPSQTMMLSAASTNNHFNVLSSPTILTTDNEEAEIIVGENVPFLSSTTSSLDNLNNTYNSIDRQDVGITLRLTPQISSRDYVKLNIFTEVSNVITATADSTLGPTTTIRTSQTTVIAKDSQMIVIGGLISESAENSNAGVPYLRNIPILGHLFRSHSDGDERNNLLIFITPRIIKDQFDIRDNSIARRDKFKDFINQEEIYPDRNEILQNPDIDRVIESEIYNGKKPSTILPPVNSYNEKSQKKTISLTVKPRFKEVQRTNNINETKINGNEYIIMKALNTDLNEKVPFNITDNGLIGIVIPKESNVKAHSFFKVGGTYEYKLKNSVLKLNVIEAFSNSKLAPEQYNDKHIKWYVLSPFELIKLGQFPWVKN